MACKLAPSSYDLDAFLVQNGKDAVVFRAQVMSAQFENPGDRQHIAFRTAQWWRGRPRAEVKAQGQRHSMPGTSCEGQFDFIVEPGSEWLIIGEERNGVVFPSALLSVRLNGQVIPALLLHRLGAVQIE